MTALSTAGVELLEHDRIDVGFEIDVRVARILADVRGLRLLAKSVYAELGDEIAALDPLEDLLARVETVRVDLGGDGL